MPNSTIKKVEAASSPRGEMGQRYLVAGKRVSMRIWIDEPGGKLRTVIERIRDGGLRDLRQRDARDRGSNAKLKTRRLMVRAGGCHASLYDY